MTLLSALYHRSPREWIAALNRADPHAVSLNLPRYESLLESIKQRFARYQTSYLKSITPQAFRDHIEAQLAVIDHEVEGYTLEELHQQRDLSVRFVWGHNHDFGEFRVDGRMKNRHLELLALFCTLFDIELNDFEDRNVFDIGCWTGGTTLALASLGSKIIAIEEVRKYAQMTQFLCASFDIINEVSVSAMSLYECDAGFYDRFDIVYCPGVIYHLSDPVLALRILFNALKPGGFILVESAGIDRPEPLCLFEGSQFNSVGSKMELTRGGWNWFLPSASALESMMQEAGFEQTRSVAVKQSYWDFALTRRLYGYGLKTRQVGICKAGLSVPSIR